MYEIRKEEGMGGTVTFVALASAIVAATTNPIIAVIATVYVITVRVLLASAAWSSHRGQSCLPGARWSPGSITVAQGERSGNFFPFCTVLF